MKKIKLFLITLLCMVGVMNVGAQDNTATVTINEENGEISNGKTWTAKDALFGGYYLTIVDDGATTNYGMSFDGGELKIHVGNGGAGTNTTHNVDIKAPMGWVITGCQFDVVTTKRVILTSGAVSVLVGNETVAASGSGNYTNTELNTSSFSLTVKHTDGTFAGDATFSDFKVSLKRIEGDGVPSINDNLANTVNGHWFWVQETPTAGNIYKIVNATSNESNIVAIGPRSNNTVESGSGASESSVLVNDMVKAGEWLIANSGDGVTITSVDDEDVVGVYQSHIDIPGSDEKFGADWNQVWTISEPIKLYGVDGHNIHCNFDVDINIIVTRITGNTECYLRLSDGFQWIQNVTGLKTGNMGWSGQNGTGIFKTWLQKPINSIQHLWNFYSIEQYDCYVDFMTAYNAFDKLPYDIYYNNPDYPEYTEVYNIVNAAGKRWQGETEETRDETYEIIDRMLNVIATIKGGNDKDEKPEGVDDADWPINNPGSEHTASFDGWRSRRITTDNTDISKAVKTVGNAHSDAATFELQNATMSQMVSGIKSGVYELSVYWKSDNAGAEITLQAKSSAETVKNSFFVKDKATEAADANGYRKAVVEVVVVDKNVTVGATVNTYNGASVYLDDFKLEYVCKNYWELNEAGDTRVYRGVFLGSEAVTPVGNIKKEHPDNEAKAFVTDDVPFADITQAYFVSFEFDNIDNPNGLCYTKAESTKKIQTKVKPEGTDVDDVNVVRGHVNRDGEIVDGECKMLALVDGHPYSVKYTFVADDANYTMSSFGVITEKVTEKDETGTEVEKDVKVGYGTLMLPYAMELPKDEETGNPIVEVYTVGAVNEATGVLTLSPATSIVANVPYIVKHKAVGADDKAIFATSSKNQTFAPVNVTYKPDNLAGTYKKTTIKVDTNCYLLQKHGNTVGFYLIEKDRVSNPFRCYLQLPAKVLNALSIVFADEDDTTGIKEVESVDNGAVYDLSGRRVENISRPGVYIMNGKKFLVK